MRQLNIPLQLYEEWFGKFMEHPEPCIVCGSVPKGTTLVCLSRSSDYNEEALAEFDNILVERIYHSGGTLICGEDTIIAAYFTETYMDGKLDSVVDYLCKKGINAVHDENDILCDGFKVGSESRRRLNEQGLRFYGIFLSFNVDPNMVNKLCTKTMTKVPKGLSDYGITRKEILDVLGLSE